MKTFLGSWLASTIQAIETGLRAYFILSERDAQTLASAYGFPSPQIEDLQDKRPHGSASTVSIPRKTKLPQRLTPPYRPIPLYHVDWGEWGKKLVPIGWVESVMPWTLLAAPDER